MKKKEILEKIRSRCTKNSEWIVDNIQYLTIMGSHAYGTATKNSDWDVYGFTIPPKEYVFPNIINGFEKPLVFNQFEGQFKEGVKSKHLDFTIYNITKYFSLVMQNNPNMLDSLFTKPNCELFVTSIGRLVKDNRKLFLHKGMYHRFKGYSFSQLKKIRTKPDDRISSERKANIEKYGFDLKFAIHLFRLLLEVEQLLTTGDLDLTRDREQLKLIAKGFYSLDEVHDWFKKTEVSLEQVYQNSKLPYGPRIKEIRKLLLTCLNTFYINQ